MSLTCLSEPFTEENQLIDQTRHSCSIGNPFRGPGNIQLRVQLMPGGDSIGNENDVIVNFTVGSINPERPSTVVDSSNFDTLQLSFEGRANISIESG